MSFFQNIGKAFSDAGKAIGSVATDVYETARNSVVVQAAAAVATGGMSLIVQGAVEAASGKGGPISSAVKDIGEDPLRELKKVPGVILGVATGSGIIGDALGIASRHTDSSFLDDSARILNTTNKVMQDDPAASLGIIAGAAMAITGVGTAAGVAAVASGVAKIAGNVVVSEVKRNAEQQVAAKQQAMQAAGTYASGAPVATLGARLTPAQVQKFTTPKAKDSAGNGLIWAAAAAALALVVVK